MVCKRATPVAFPGALLEYRDRCHAAVSGSPRSGNTKTLHLELGCMVGTCVVNWQDSSNLSIRRRLPETTTRKSEL
jgi:hypothetical protein